MAHDVVIIGSGPAGYTAALYAGRANLRPLLFAGEQPGGQLMITTDVENYPGFPDGVMGPEMMTLFLRQAERFGCEVREQTIAKLDLTGPTHRVQVEGEWIEARTVILATGASAKWLGLPSEVEFGGYGVSACATCDGFFFRDKEVLVVGGGDTAMEEANYLTRHASKVSVVHRREAFRASKIMQDRVLANPKVEVLWNTEVDEILGQRDPVKKVTGARLRDARNGATREVPIDGVFIAIGHKPNSELVAEWLELDDLGYVVMSGPSTRTKVPGLFVCGDVADRVYRQAVTAAGTGCMAAIDAERYLEAMEA